MLTVVCAEMLCVICCKFPDLARLQSLQKEDELLRFAVDGKLQQEKNKYPENLPKDLHDDMMAQLSEMERSGMQ
jgi:hypothetical protein